MTTHSKWSKVSASILAVGVGIGMSSAVLANDDVLSKQGGANVVMPSITYNGWNFSTLKDINAGNVADLRPVWTMQLDAYEQFEASPLVVGDTMYIISPITAAGADNAVMALDLSKNGVIKWQFRPDISEEMEELAFAGACCSDQTRGFHYAEGKIFMQTLDGRVMALDAESGEALWQVRDTNLDIAETLTGVGTVIHDLYVVGVAGGEYGVRGRVTAYNIDTGNLVWRYHNMGPNNEVGITDRFKPFYDDDKIDNPALASWWGDSWRRGGGTVWGYFTWDEDADIFHYATGNCGPWNPDYRREWGKIDLDANGGLETYRNNYCASQMARDGTTGELVWAYNIVPQDQWDLDQPLISPLVDLNIGGQMRKTTIKAARNGWFYVWDRLTGEMVTEPWMFAYTDFMTGVDMATGRPLYNIDDVAFTDVEDRLKYTQADQLTDAQIAELEDPDEYTGTEITWCPGIFARNWQNDAWSPDTGLLYTSTLTNCRTMIVFAGDYDPGKGYTLQRRAGRPPSRDINGNETEVVGALEANSPTLGKTVWSVKWTESNNTPILATAGGLVFQGGTDQGVARAFDAATGEILWTFRTGSEFYASPISYEYGGTQYIAFVASTRGRLGAVAIDDAADEPARFARGGATLYVFAL